ncbi:sugar porter family MFS transporter [Aureibaculum sp. 2210JD6-5]|uniref:sugar porter family MFS transporter n=1 Tax=Aureibaculum sp. 2210JD6-5 TaxID=3103957 RepID=UPI002AAF00F6|nr:sugar porter family MFS transporter [Aureibaculum sp. 2210JD6-5]MDY7395806.1 sugar porter family MFS transporter [Aureibaculum sp. 2210JD6-5]
MSNKNFNIKYIGGISMVSALGGLLFGYDWVVIGGAKPFYEQFFQIADSPSLQGWAVSCALVGCIIGAIISGVLSDKYGRKKLLILAATLFSVSAIGTGLANTFTSFVIYRIIGGVGIGLASTLSPVYIAEVSPAYLRGRLVTINQLTIVIGILLAQIVNWGIADAIPENTNATEILNSWNGQTGWRYMFWAEAIPALLFFILIWLIPDSPRWLVKKKKSQKATAILSKIGGLEYAKNTIDEIKTSLLLSVEKAQFKDVLHSKAFPIVVIGVVLAVFQQWCGINVIFLYADEIFSSAGISTSDLLFTVVITGGVNLVFTLLSMLFVDSIGRKTLMLIGSLGLALIYTVLGFLYYSNVEGTPLLLLVVSAIAVYAMTLAPVTWVILSEIFPNKIRGMAMAIATFALWIGNTLLAYFFPIINKKFEASGSFWLFAFICFAGFLFIKYRIVETKGKTLEQIEKEMNL